MKKQFNFYMQQDVKECFSIIRERYPELSGLSDSQLAEICIKCFVDHYTAEDFCIFYKKFGSDK